MESMKRLLFWLLEGSKGGPTRIALLRLLFKKPMNMRRLSLAAKLDYKTTEHHVELMRKNSILECAGNGYGKVYFISEIVSDEKEFRILMKGGKNGKKDE
ncbi:winged helix-turn-helix domain-containing protein [Candidatus Micrarchaeota archaeon]|nr:winged helix-turn-helix domain-containing protein [Candidatus Micrarchaeota archaeon]